MKLQYTNNYGLFVPNDDQRKLDQNHAKRLAQSMSKVGFIPSKPIQCYKRGENLVIVDGHHRYEAAKAIGSTIYYVIEGQESQHMIAAENYLVKKWNKSDFVRTYANRGNPDYMELVKYSALSGLSLSAVCSMMSNEQASSGGNQSKAVSQGTWKIKDREQINAYITLKNKVNRKEVSHPRFLNAWSKCFFTPEFDHNMFIHKLKINQGLITTCNNEDQALAMIEQIYNHKQSAKIPLAFLAKENAKRRQQGVIGRIK